jgi:hypothetical protein
MMRMIFISMNKFRQALLEGELFSIIEIIVFTSCSISSKDFFEIGIPCEGRDIVSEASNRFGSVRSYSWELYEFLCLSWEDPSIVFRNNFCCFENISCSGVVSKSLVVGKEFFITCICKTIYTGVSIYNTIKISYYTIRLSLLEKNLSEPDSIESYIFWEIILSPREMVSSIDFVPIDEVFPGK